MEEEADDDDDVAPESSPPTAATVAQDLPSRHYPLRSSRRAPKYCIVIVLIGSWKIV